MRRGLVLILMLLIAAVTIYIAATQGGRLLAGVSVHKVRVMVASRKIPHGKQLDPNDDVRFTEFDQKQVPAGATVSFSPDKDPETIRLQGVRIAQVDIEMGGVILPSMVALPEVKVEVGQPEAPPLIQLSKSDLERKAFEDAKRDPQVVVLNEADVTRLVQDPLKTADVVIIETRTLASGQSVERQSIVAKDLAVKHAFFEDPILVQPPATTGTNPTPGPGQPQPIVVSPNGSVSGPISGAAGTKVPDTDHTAVGSTSEHFWVSIPDGDVAARVKVLYAAGNAQIRPSGSVSAPPDKGRLCGQSGDCFDFK